MTHSSIKRFLLHGDEVWFEALFSLPSDSYNGFDLAYIPVRVTPEIVYLYDIHYFKRTKVTKECLIWFWNQNRLQAWLGQSKTCDIKLRSPSFWGYRAQTLDRHSIPRRLSDYFDVLWPSIIGSLALARGTGGQIGRWTCHKSIHQIKVQEERDMMTCIIGVIYSRWTK